MQTWLRIWDTTFTIRSIITILIRKRHQEILQYLKTKASKNRQRIQITRMKIVISMMLSFLTNQAINQTYSIQSSPTMMLSTCSQILIQILWNSRREDWAKCCEVAPFNTDLNPVNKKSTKNKISRILRSNQPTNQKMIAICFCQHYWQMRFTKKGVL